MVNEHYSRSAVLRGICVQRKQNDTSDGPQKCDKYDKNMVSCTESGTFLRTQVRKKLHRAAHKGEKKLKCDQCCRSFARKQYLIRHMVVHTGEKSFKCEQSSKFFARKGDMKGHMVVQSSEIRFKCEQCGKVFCKKARLDKSHGGAHW